MCSKVALTGSPLFSGDGIATAELLTFKFAYTITARAVFHYRLNENAVNFDTGIGLDGVLKNCAHRKSSK
jgi:hypothetical protein